MRPQHITAENVSITRDKAKVDCASMRPQHITAENEPDSGVQASGQGASMRPQHITAENVAAQIGRSVDAVRLQ